MTSRSISRRHAVGHAPRRARHRPRGGNVGIDEARANLVGTVLPRLAGIGIIALTRDSRDAKASPCRHRARVLGGRARLEREHRDDRVADRRARRRCPRADVSHHSRRSSPAGVVLEAEGLVKMYRRRKVVNDVALRLQQGEIVGLLGPNGAGKTTTFYMIVGLIQPLAGRILLDGADITKMPMYRRARRGIGYLSQEPSIFRKLSVEDNILAILETLPDSRATSAARASSRCSNELGIKHLRRRKGVRAFGRRAASARDHPRAGYATEVHDARRTVRGGRSDRCS